MSLNDIVDKLITILKAAGTLSSIKEWHKGEPPEGRWAGFPLAWVEWNGGPIIAASHASDKKYEDSFFIAVIHKADNEDVAEVMTMTLIEAIEEVIEGNPTLDGLVDVAIPSMREKVKEFRGDQSLVAARLTVKSYQRK